MGLRAIVESAVNASSVNVQDAWKFASFIERNDPMLLELMQLNNITDEVVDQVFVFASTL